MTVESLLLVLSFLVTAAMLWNSRGQKHAAARSAHADAEVARIEWERRAQEVADTERQRVLFELIPPVWGDGGTKSRSRSRRDDEYVLRHVGTEIAHGVRVDPQGLIAEGDLEFASFAPGEERLLLLLPTAREPGTGYLGVTWHHLADRSDQQQFTHLLIRRT